MNDKTMESNSSKSEWPGQQHVAMLANTGFYYAGISDLFCLFIDFRNQVSNTDLESLFIFSYCILELSNSYSTQYEAFLSHSFHSLTKPRKQIFILFTQWFWQSDKTYHCFGIYFQLCFRRYAKMINLNFSYFSIMQIYKYKDMI